MLGSMFTDVKLERGIWTVDQEVVEKGYFATWVHPLKDDLKAV